MTVNYVLVAWAFFLRLGNCTAVTTREKIEISEKAASFTPSGNYFRLLGRDVANDSGAQSGGQPSGDGRRYDELDRDISAQGFIADNIMLQICDGRSDCDFIASYDTTPNPGVEMGSLVEFFKRDSNKSAYIHLTRCMDGVTGTNVTAPISGGLYKKCVGTFDELIAIGSYSLPPGSLSVCEQACDKDPTCTMFTIDKAGQNCWLSKFSASVWNYTLYLKMPNGVSSS